MSRLRDFFIGLPAACGAPNAERWGQLNAIQFDHEISNPSSVFADHGETVMERLETAFGWAGRSSDKVGVENYARNLAVLAATSYEVDVKGRKDLENNRNTMAGTLMTMESGYPTVSALLTVSEARTMGNWG